VSRPRQSIPSYLEHKQSGKARAVWTDQTGNRQFRMLPGLFESQESRTTFARLQLELAAVPYRSPGRATDVVTVNEVLVAFLEWADGHYRRADGSTTDEIDEYKRVARYVRELYGLTPAKDFGPLALKAIRQKFIEKGWCRKFVNKRTERVRRVFKFAVSEELVPPSVYQGLATVSGLKLGRTVARETEPIEPVDDAVVDATLPHLRRHVRGLVELQRLTGCRPGEACSLQRRDIDMGGTIWLYRPRQHKGAHRGKPRTISIGPKAQALLREFFTPDMDEYLFSPARSLTERSAERSANRKTPIYPSNAKRNATKRKVNPKRMPAKKYSKDSYGLSVDRACDKAFPPPEPLAQQPGETHAKWWGRLTSEERTEVKAWQKVHRWAPNRLRHTFGTKVRKNHGLEAAQVMLGHSKANTTEIYAEKNEALAATVASKIG
jgi:integrase